MDNHGHLSHCWMVDTSTDGHLNWYLASIQKYHKAILLCCEHVPTSAVSPCLAIGYMKLAFFFAKARIQLAKVDESLAKVPWEAEDVVNPNSWQSLTSIRPRR